MSNILPALPISGDEGLFYEFTTDFIKTIKELNKPSIAYYPVSYWFNSPPYPPKGELGRKIDSLRTIPPSD